MTEPLTIEERTALAEAIRAAEAGTAGEIRVVVTTRPLVERSFFALIWAALIALILPWPLALMTTLGTAELLSLQAGIFAVIGGALAFTPLGRLAVPRRVLERAARTAAIDQFIALGIDHTRGRTGLLILVALPERLVEVVADDGIHAKVGQGAWQDVCAAVLAGAREGRLTEGLTAGIAIAGQLLVSHVPASSQDANELPDHMIIL